MGFSESVKLAVKQRAHFRCCICQRHSVSLEIHHIIPEADGGEETEDNAAPLCPTCHEEYVANPIKRTAIRVQRDFWFELCDRRFVLDAERVDRLSTLLERNTSALTGFQDFLNRVSNQAGVAEVPTAYGYGRALAPTVTVAAHDSGVVSADETVSVTVGEGAEDAYDEEDFQQEPRTEIEILEALENLFDQVWYNRHWNLRIAIENGKDTVDPGIWKQASAAAAEVEEKYKDDPDALGPWDDFEWGMLNGKFSALRWVLGDEWDFLDT